MDENCLQSLTLSAAAEQEKLKAVALGMSAGRQRVNEDWRKNRPVAVKG